MVRKPTSTPASASQEDTKTMPSSQPSSSPQATPSQSQPPAQHQQVTEQQLKSRAENGVNVEDYLLPRSLTARLAKSVLPPNTTIQKDALLAMQKAATVFVSYLSSHANEATLKRTVVPTDVFSAIEELEFGGFKERLEKELEVYTEIKAGKRKKAEPVSATEKKDGEKVDEEETGVRGSKRVKRVGEGEPGQTKGDGEVEGEGDEDVPEPGEEDIEEEEAEEDEDDEEEEEEGEEAQEDDINLVEDLDRDSRAQRTMDPDAGADSDSDNEGPGSQLRGDMGMD